MAMSDPISDMLVRIKNALRAGHETVDIPSSRVREEICRVLKSEGYIRDFMVSDAGYQGRIRVELKYLEDRQPVIQGIRRVSKPSLRIYKQSKDLKPVRSGLGISIVTTSRGVMTGKQARAAHVGGEVLCEVW